MTDKRKESRAGSLLVLLNKEQREQIDKAARITGRASSGFLRYVGLKDAYAILRANPRRRHSMDGQTRCEICSPMRCVKAKG